MSRGALACKFHPSTNESYSHATAKIVGKEAWKLLWHKISSKVLSLINLFMLGNNFWDWQWNISYRVQGDVDHLFLKSGIVDETKARNDVKAFAQQHKMNNTRKPKSNPDMKIQKIQQERVQMQTK